MAISGTAKVRMKGHLHRNRFVSVFFAERPSLISKTGLIVVALVYLGARYGIKFLSPQGVSTEGDASAKDVANLIRQIKRERIKAVFIENMSNPKVLEQLSKEADISPAGELYPDALSAADGPAPNYLKMMRHNVEQLLAGLKQN